MPITEEERVRRLEVTVYGNGEPGLTEMMRNQSKSIEEIQTKLQDLEDKVDNLLRQRQSSDDERLGAHKLLMQVRAGVLVLIVVFGSQPAFSIIKGLIDAIGGLFAP